MKNPETRLSNLVEFIRSRIRSSDFVSIVSQLFVLAALVRKDSGFRKATERATESSQVLIGELLSEGLTALERTGADYPTALININSNGWSSLSSAEVNVVLEELARIDLSPHEMGRWLLRRAYREMKGKIEDPEKLFMLAAALAPEANSVYLPFDDSALALFEATEEAQKVTLRPESESIHRLLRRALFVADREATLQTLSPYSPEDIPDASLTLIVPPFGGRPEITPSTELPAIFERPHSLASEEMALTITGVGSMQRVVALVPSGLLFRGGRSRTLREWLVDTVGLTAVIELPARLLFWRTLIRCALLLIEPGKTGKREAIRFVAADDSDRFLHDYKWDPSDPFRHAKWRELAVETLKPLKENSAIGTDVDKSVIRENDYVLNPDRYKKQALDSLLEGLRTTNLGSLCRIMFPVPIKDSENDRTSSFFEEVLMSDFAPEGTVGSGSKERHLDAATASKARRHQLRPGDILLGVKGTIGKVALVAEGAHKNLLAGQSMVILRLQDRDRIDDPVYLLRYLSLPAVRVFLQSMAGGSAIRFLRAKDLANLPVPIHSSEQQSRIKERHEEIVESIQIAQDFFDEARRFSDQAFDLTADPAA